MLSITSKLYAILDRTSLDAHGVEVVACARELAEAGVRLMQYRDKDGPAQQVMETVGTLKEALAGFGVTLILNDRVELAVKAGVSGVHVGHLDMPPNVVRRLVGDGMLIGVSTHNGTQVLEADAGATDYVAIGPVFATSTKRDAEPVVGLEGVRRARSLTQKPLVAIGGITAENARSVIEAGADAVAVISGLLPRDGRSARAVAEDFLARLR